MALDSRSFRYPVQISPAEFRTEDGTTIYALALAGDSTMWQLTSTARTAGVRWERLPDLPQE